MIMRGTPVQIRPGVLGLDLVDLGTLTGVARSGPDLAGRVHVEIDWFGPRQKLQPIWIGDLLVLCPTCEKTEPGDLAPRHKASDRCESGGRDHCSCATCF